MPRHHAETWAPPPLLDADTVCLLGLFCTSIVFLLIALITYSMYLPQAQEAHSKKDFEDFVIRVSNAGLVTTLNNANPNSTELGVCRSHRAGLRSTDLTLLT
jgi:hypothetical protein